MSRYFAIQTWVGSHENEPDYNGHQCGERNVRSIEVPTFDRNGKPNFQGFSDEAIEARKPKKKPSLTIQQKILPQASRVERLTEQLKELVQEYKKGNIDIDEYSMLLSVISSKRDRAIKLLSKAKSVRAPFEIEEEEDGISLGKTHVKNEKSSKTSKRSATEGGRFKAAKKPTIFNSNFLLKAFTFLAKNDWVVFVGSSTILFTAAKIIL